MAAPDERIPLSEPPMETEITRIDGKALIEMGFKPAPWFKNALKAAAATPGSADLRTVIERVRDD